MIRRARVDDVESSVATSIEIATLVGSFGLFFTCFLIFCRLAPVIAIAEVKGAARLKKRESAETVEEEKAA